MKVVVVGGGMAGLTVCTSLRKFDKHVEIILVEPKEYIEIHWCSYRSLFDKDLAEKSLLDINKWAIPKSVRHIRANVTQLTDTDCTLSNGEHFEFNICVLCTGSMTKFPGLGKGPTSGKAGIKSGSRERRLQQMETEGLKLLNAETVLIVGGGLIGVETAGDLAYHAKQQSKAIKITLVHSQEQLVQEFTPRAAEMAKRKLEQLGVEVILNEKVIQQENGKVTLEKAGTEMVAKEVVWTTGIYSCNAFLDRKYKDKRGWIQVDDYFRVKGAENKLFALGDCCDLLPNSGSQILNTMGMIGKNIKVILDATEKGSFENVEKKMRKALEMSSVYVATIGKQTGVAMTPMCHTQFFLPWIKNSTMFLFKPKGDLGLKEV
jgi:NADH dehydrogenase FAD-containing subunit